MSCRDQTCPCQDADPCHYADTPTSKGWPMPPADEKSPDHSTCRNCGAPIDWDDVCYIHRTGFADCGTIISGGTPLGERILMNPEIKVDPAFDGKMAEPIEWGPPT